MFGHSLSSSCFRSRLHVRRAQQLVDALGLGEPVVDTEADIGCEFQIDAVRDFGPQKFLVALEGGNTVFGVAAAQRHHVDRRQPQVGGDPHFRHRDHVSFDDRIVHVAAREHVGERVPHQFADAQLALRAAGR